MAYRKTQWRKLQANIPPLFAQMGCAPEIPSLFRTRVLRQNA
jgi:hypothetical protein